MAKNIIMTFSEDGALILSECSAVGIRQGDAGGAVSFVAKAKGISPKDHVAKLHYERPDGKRQGNVIMSASERMDGSFVYTPGTAWFFAEGGEAKATITITDASGAIAAQGSYSFAIEPTQVDVESGSIDYEEAAALEAMIAKLSAEALRSAVPIQGVEDIASAAEFVAAAENAAIADHIQVKDGDRYSWEGTHNNKPHIFVGEFFGEGLGMVAFEFKWAGSSIKFISNNLWIARRGATGEWESYEPADASLFLNGAALKAIADGNGEVIADTYLKKTETAVRATSDSDGNVIKNVYLKKTETAAKAVADADGNEIKSTYSKFSDVQDTLSSAEATKPLSANKGRELNEKLNYKADLLDGKIPASQIPGSFADSESFASAKLVIVPNDTVLGLEYLVTEDRALNNSEFMNKYNGIFDMNYGQIAYTDPMNVDLIGMVAIPQDETRYALWAIKPMRAENGYYSMKEKVYVGRIYVDYTTNLEYRAKYGNDVYAFGKDPTFDDAFFQLSKGIAIGETADSAFAGNRGVALEESVSDLAQTKMDKSAVADVLSSDSATDPLSARQGKALDEKKIDKADVVDDLKTDDASKPLSARQGKAIDEKKANVDGYYQEMGVGIADQLAATIGNETSGGYSFRPTGGGASVGNRATMKKIQAVSVVRNQMARMAQSISGRGLTATYQGGNVYKINGTYDSSIAPVLNLWQNYPYVFNGHTYLVVINLTNCPASTKIFCWNLGQERRTQSFIQKVSASGKSTVTFQIEANEGTVFSNAMVESALIDLTLFFGSNDRIPEGLTVADFFALVGNVPIEYNKGTLASTDLSGFETVGYNLFKINGRTKGDAGEWSKDSVRPNLSESEYYVGMTANNFYNEERIASYSFIQNGLKINAKEAGYGIGFPVKVIGGQAYNLEGKSSQGNFVQRIGWYDKSGHLIKFDIFDVNYIPYAIAPINAYWALIVLSPRSQNVDEEITDVSFHLKLSGSRTGYEPYEKHDYSLSFQGNGIFPDSNNNNVETTGDELTPDGKIARNFGIIDMGEIDWNYDNVNKRFISNNVNNYSDLIKHIASSSVVPNILCSKYAVSSFDLLLNNEKAIALYTDDLLYLRDLDYENSDDLKASLSGAKIIFPLENPISEKSAPFNKNVVVDDYGTERFLGNVPIARPITLYQADLAEFVQSLYTISGGNASKFAMNEALSNVSAKVNEIANSESANNETMEDGK